MLKFICGMFVGSFIGIAMMCLCAISGKGSYMEDRREWKDE